MELAIFSGGVLLRLYLISKPFFRSICDGVMFSTPLTSWERAMEGCFLMDQGMSPYEGDMVHESPVILLFINFLINNVKPWIPAIFIVVDLFTAYVLKLTAQNFVKAQLAEERCGGPSRDVTGAAGRPSAETVSLTVAAVYLLNPSTAASCAAQSTAGLHLLFLALVFYAAVSERWGWCVPVLAVSSYLDLYPLALLPPVLARTGDLGRSRALALMTFLAVLAALLALSVHGTGDWSFLRSTYGFILLAADLSPNMGLFWYFFTEMFQHFESLFIATFQINAFIYAIPLTLRFRTQPVLVMYALLILLVTFKSYPSVSDAALYMAMLPLWRHLAAHARYGFLVTCFYVSTIVLAPVMWTLWVHAGSANANFFFAVTLAYNAAQIFLVTDLLFAQLKREHVLAHGSCSEIDGKPAKLVLS